MAERRRCERAGCRGYAVGGGQLCKRHGAEEARMEAGREVGIEAGSQYRKFLTAEERTLVALARDTPGLEGEVEVARVAVMRALEENDLGEVLKGLGVVLRLVEAQRRLAGDQAAGIVAAVTQILNELAPGGRDEG